jgi:amino acid transporter
MLVVSKRVLWVLLVLNWVCVAFFAAFLAALLSPIGAHVVGELSRLYPPDRAMLMVRAMIWLMALGIVAGFAVHIMFRRMLAIVATAIAGDPFTLANARRLRVVGWALLAIQILDLVFGALSITVNARGGEPFGWSPSVGGWISVLMVFVLAQVFEQGSRMRDELAMTV